MIGNCMLLTCSICGWMNIHPWWTHAQTKLGSSQSWLGEILKTQVKFLLKLENLRCFFTFIVIPMHNLHISR